MSRGAENDPKCHLCDGGPADWCYGCRRYICDEHIDNPWGPHDPEDHDSVGDDEGDDI